MRRDIQLMRFSFFFFNDTATTEIYTLSLHDALPICVVPRQGFLVDPNDAAQWHHPRSEEHTSELQSRLHLVCRLLLEKKKGDKVKITLRFSCRDIAHQQIRTRLLNPVKDGRTYIAND